MILSNYATKTEIIQRENKSPADYWPIGIDYGFSGVKGFSPNKVFCFPNCAVQMKEYNTLTEPSDTDIVLRDSESTWIIGEKAHEIISSENAMNYESEMYGRNRYFSPIFQALMKVGLGIALSNNKFRAYNGEPIVIQTGLPPKYKKQDTGMIKEAIAGSYSFDLKIGKKPFVHYQFIIKENNVFVMDQPMGSLISTITDNDGIQAKEDYRILTSNTIVFDPGFKTLDIYDITAGMYKGSNTFDTLGMHAVFQSTINLLEEKYDVNLTVAQMQNILHKGFVTSFDRKQMSTAKISFDEELELCTQKICRDAIQKLISIYNYLQNHEFMIITGGTGNAWFSYIEDYFKNMKGLTILSANKNDTTLSNTYSNVRGYYYYLIGMLERRRR